MAICTLCGRPAGWFSNKHPECNGKFLAGITELKALANKALVDDTELTTLPAVVTQIGARSYVSGSASKSVLVQAWSDAVDSYADASGVDSTAEKRLLDFLNAFSLNQHDFDGTRAYEKLVKSLILRDISAGVLPNRARMEGPVSINLQKGEQIVWLYKQCELLEDKTVREFVGRSSGISVRIAKGVYYRTGAFRGHPIERTERRNSDTGTAAFTNKNIYFVGSRKSFRTPYKKIVSFMPFTDGIGIMKDTANAKVQVLVTGDGWFTYNLANGLSHLE
jgi:hypothetical protein